MIDAVITYVDGSDEKWLEKYRSKVTKPIEETETRYRSYDCLDLQVRLIRKFMKFVDNIFIVVDSYSQVEKYSFTEEDNVTIVTHEEIIPKRYLPCFNSCAIEMFFYNIKDLKENFVYFNDDVFVVSECSEDDFFVNGKPCISFNEKNIELENNDSIFDHNIANSCNILKEKFPVKRNRKKYVRPSHSIIPLKKSSYTYIWTKCFNDVDKSLTRTRHRRNYNVYLFTNYEYYVRSYVNKKLPMKFYTVIAETQTIYDDIKNDGLKSICINDVYVYEFDKFKIELHKVLESNLLDKEYIKPKEEIKKEIKSKYEKSFIVKNNINKDIINLLSNAKFRNICVDVYLSDKQLFKEKILEHRNIFENDYKDFIIKLNSINPDNDFGNKIYNNEKAVISLTTWKNRIITVSKTLYNLLVQCPNFHIVLVLSEDEFPNKENEFPNELKLFLKHNLIEILWVKKNYKAFKKILFTMNKYRNVPIISADDDCIYLYNYAEAFYNEWIKNKDSFISCWKRDIDGIVHTAGASTLYPPYIFKNLGIKCLCDEILKYTNQDDDYYTELRRELKLNNVKIIKRWNLTYYFHDEINPLHDEIKLTTKKDLHNFLKNIIDKYKKDIIVSMTSYPKRINNIYISIKLLLEKQTLKPDKIYLWLSEEEFPNKENDLPNNLLTLIKTNNEIILKWLKINTYVHKRHEIFKYVNNGYVFFLDDDVEYNPGLIEYVVNISKQYPNTIILYNRYSPHIYEGIKIRYKRNNDCILGGPYVNKFRWCGQSMIPANIYPKEILSDEYQQIRNNTSPVSDECWFQPWVVYYDIPLYSCDFGWGKDISEDTGKKTGLVSWSHQKNEQGYERRDIWLNKVLTAFPNIYKKYEDEFNYGK